VSKLNKKNGFEVFLQSRFPIKTTNKMKRKKSIPLNLEGGFLSQWGKSFKKTLALCYRRSKPKKRCFEI
jgi:hypothetical protein